MLDFAASEGKPLALDEVGVRYLNCDRTAWVTNALPWIKSQPRIDAVLWFESNVGADPAAGLRPEPRLLAGRRRHDARNNVETFDSWKSITGGDSYWLKAPK